MRAHLNKTLRDDEGNLIVGALVQVLNAGTTSPVAGPLYALDSGETVLDNPFVATEGVISFYLAAPLRVRLGVTPPGGIEVVYDDVDVTEPTLMISLSGAGTNSTAASGAPTAPESSAEASGENSTAVGVGSVAQGPNSTAVGLEASVDTTAEGGVALGFGAASNAVGTVVIGSGADSTTLAAHGVVVGETATGQANQVIAVGNNANAGGDYSIVIGAEATDGGEPNNVIIGQNASASASAPGEADNDIVIGRNAYTDDAYQSVVVGTEAHSSGDNSVAVGQQSNVSGYAGTAVGTHTVVSGDSGTALGEYAKVTDTAGIALGSGAQALATGAIAIGSQVHVSGDDSWAIGSGLTITDPNVGVVRAQSVEIVPPLYPAPKNTSLILHATNDSTHEIGVENDGTLTVDGSPLASGSSTTETVLQVASTTAALTINDPATAETITRGILNANCTVTLPAPAAAGSTTGRTLTVALTQDGAGGRTVAWTVPSGGILWANGYAPTQTPTANKTDVYTFMDVGIGSWLAFVAGQNF